MKTIEDLLNDAHNFFLSEKFSEAASVYESLLYDRMIDGTNRTIAEFEYAWVLYRLNRWDETIALLSRLVNEGQLQKNQLFDAWRLLGFSQLRKNLIGEAIDSLRKAEAYPVPESEKKYVWFELGRIYFSEGKYPEALSYLAKCRDFFEVSDDYHSSATYLLGFCQMFIGNLDDAFTEFSRLEELAVSEEFLAGGLYGMAHIYFRRNKYEALLEVSKNLMNVYPDFHDKETVAFFIVKSFFELERWDEFKMFYEEFKTLYGEGRYREVLHPFDRQLDKLIGKYE